MDPCLNGSQWIPVIIFTDGKSYDNDDLKDNVDINLEIKDGFIYILGE